MFVKPLLMWVAERSDPPQWHAEHAMPALSMCLSWAPMAFGRTVLVLPSPATGRPSPLRGTSAPWQLVQAVMALAVVSAVLTFQPVST